MPTPNPVNTFIVLSEGSQGYVNKLVFSKDKTLTVFDADEQEWTIVSPVLHSDQIDIPLSLENWRKIHRIFTTNVGPWTKRASWEQYAHMGYKFDPTDEDNEMFIGENKEYEVTCFPIR